MPASAQIRHILLADDDKDDNDLFREVLAELPIFTELATVSNGEQLMQFLSEEKDQLPDILFLDLNLPRKNGLECLIVLKRDEALKRLIVIIFTTSNEQEVINLLYKNGAQYYIRKPNNFEELKKIIHLALTLTEHEAFSQPPREKFVLSSQSVIDELK